MEKSVCVFLKQKVCSTAGLRPALGAPMGVRQAGADGALSQGPHGSRVSGIHMITVPWGKVEALETHLVL